MNKTYPFIPYASEHFSGCLVLFDANCPEFFTPNERGNYAVFLNKEPAGYLVNPCNHQVIGAFGLIDEGILHRRRLNWILINPDQHGKGLGRAMIEYSLAQARNLGVKVIDIAASHKSAAFFERFGGKRIHYIKNGWGSNMHRIDMELQIR